MIRSVLLASAVLGLVGTSFAQTIIQIPMDQQINVGVPGTAQSPNGDAIYVPNSQPFNDSWMEFRNDETEGYCRNHLFGNFGTTGHFNGWYYGPYIDFNLAGYGELYCLGAGSTLEFDARYFQDWTNANPYNDAPIFTRVYNYNIATDTYQGFVDYGMRYQTGPFFYCDPKPTGAPEWFHVTIDLDDLNADANCDSTDDTTTGGAFDLARVSRMRFYGTDWNSGVLGDPSDYVDVKNVKLTLYPPPCAADLNDDGQTDLSDLTLLLSNFGSSSTPVSVWDSAGFTAYTLGDLPGQDGWVDDTTVPAWGMAQVVDDPTGGGNGKVMSIDPPGIDDANWLGAARPLDTPPPQRFVILEWDQYRGSLTDNVWMADAIAFDGWWSIQWDGGGAGGPIFPYSFSGGTLTLSAGVWQHIRYEIDTNLMVAKVIVGGDSRSANYSEVTDPDVDGIVFEVVPTAAGGEDGPIYIDNLKIAQTNSLALVGDYDVDGDVDLSDLTVLLSDFGCSP
ncbi:MAG: hypothetical protein HZB38_01425 [Planctomycetes bacterium]|nr:hypothetical protein [Planctomycetota bacterium]